MNDLRLALRLLRKSPGFSLAVVLLLGLGMGIHMSVLGLMNGIFLQPIPGVAQRGELFVAGYRETGRGGHRGSAYPSYRDLRDRTASFATLAARADARFNLSSEGHAAVNIRGEQVSANYFSVLGVKPVRGRSFAMAEDEALNSDRVIVISHVLWQEIWGGDESIIGREVRINDVPARVIGVAPEGFNGSLLPGGRDVWIPFHFRPGMSNETLVMRGRESALLIGRRISEVSAAEAQARFLAAADQLAGEYPREMRDRRAWFGSYRGFDSPDPPSKAVFMMGFISTVTLIVLLIVCANIGNLVLARVSARRRDFALRLALGARRWDLVRQTLAEGLLLGLGGAAIASVVSRWGAQAVLNLIPPEDGARLDVPLAYDGTMIGYSLLMAGLSAAAFALLPALQSSRPHLVPALKSGEAGAIRQSSRLRDVLTVAQVALCLLLVISSGLLVRSVGHLREEGGIDRSKILVGTVNPSINGYSTAAAQQLYQRIHDRISGLAGVTSAAWTTNAPLERGAYRRVRRPEQTDEEARGVLSYTTGPAYLSALGLRLREGREIEPRDTASSEPVAVINATMARRFWPNRPAAGEMLIEGKRTYRVIGVFEDYPNNVGDPPEPELHVAMAQSSLNSAALIVRTDGAPEKAAELMREAVRRADPALALYNIRTLEMVFEYSIAQHTMALRMVAISGVFALLLAAIGLYSVLSFQIAQRTREIGLRMALGATPRGVVAASMRTGMRHTAVGLAAGCVLALISTHTLASFLYGVSPLDPYTFAVAVALLLATSLMAIYIPARRATRIDPIRALRHE